MAGTLMNPKKQTKGTVGTTTLNSSSGLIVPAFIKFT